MWVVKVMMRADVIEVFQLEGSPCYISLVLKNILHAFITETIFKKTNKQTKPNQKLSCIFGSSANFERVKNMFGKLVTGACKSMGLQWNCLCGHVGLLWTSVANKLLPWEGFELSC